MLNALPACKSAKPSSTTTVQSCVLSHRWVLRKVSLISFALRKWVPWSTWHGLKAHHACLELNRIRIRRGRTTYFICLDGNQDAPKVWMEPSCLIHGVGCKDTHLSMKRRCFILMGWLLPSKSWFCSAFRTLVNMSTSSTRRTSWRQQMPRKSVS